MRQNSPDFGQKGTKIQKKEIFRELVIKILITYCLNQSEISKCPTEVRMKRSRYISKAASNLREYEVKFSEAYFEFSLAYLNCRWLHSNFQKHTFVR